MADVRHDGFGTIFATGATPTDPTGGAYSGGGGAGNTFVYRENEPSPSGNVYATFPGAYAAAIATGIPATIYIDDSLGGSSINEAGDYDLSKITLSGPGRNNNSPNVVLFISDGVTWNKGFARITGGLWVVCSFDSQPFLGTLTSEETYYMTLDEGGLINGDNYGATFDISGDNNPTLFIAMGTGGTVLSNGGCGPFLFSGGGSPSVYLTVGEGTLVDDGFLTGSNGGFQVTVDSDSAQLPVSFGNFSGEFDFTQNPKAANLSPFSGTGFPTPGGIAPSIGVGTMYFDQASGQPGWWNGTAWVRAGGSIEVLTAPGQLTMDTSKTTSVLINASGVTQSFALPDGSAGQVKYMINGSGAGNYIVVTSTNGLGNDAIDLPVPGSAALVAWSASTNGWVALAFYNGGEWD